MIIELQLHGRVILRVNIWYLILSAILRDRTSLRSGENWREADLFLCLPILEGEQRIMIPQPSEFMANTPEKT